MTGTPDRIIVVQTAIRSDVPVIPAGWMHPSWRSVRCRRRRFNPHPAHGPDATNGARGRRHCRRVSIPIQHAGWMQQFLHAQQRDAIAFQSPSSTRAGCNGGEAAVAGIRMMFQSPSSTRAGCNARRMPGLQGTGSFNPHPARGLDATAVRVMTARTRRFQYPSSTRAGCNLDGDRQSRAAAVSIPIQHAGWMQRHLHATARRQACFNPHPTRGLDATPALQIYPSPVTGFNPHPTRGLDATRRAVGRDTRCRVSIPIQHAGWMQPRNRPT